MTDFHSLDQADATTQSVWDDIKSRGVELYAEYCRAPIGAHSPNLQFVLQHFRKAPVKGKFVLVAIEPHRKWCLGKLTGVRGDPVIADETMVFTEIDEAERYVFRQRWKELTGTDPSVAGKAS